jgi:hypothetical protein
MDYKEASIQGTTGVTTYATLYFTDTGKTAVVGSILVCNTSVSPATYRVAVMSTAGIPSAADWRVFDKVVPANETVILNLPLAMQTGRYIRVSSSASTVTFAAEIQEY